MYHLDNPYCNTHLPQKGKNMVEINILQQNFIHMMIILELF